MSNSLDPDQAQRVVGPDLGPNCLPRLTADVTGRQRINLPPEGMGQGKLDCKFQPLGII